MPVDLFPPMPRHEDGSKRFVVLVSDGQRTVAHGPFWETLAAHHYAAQLSAKGLQCQIVPLVKANKQAIQKREEKREAYEKVRQQFRKARG